MKTAEVAVEQVLTGMLVLAWLALPFVDATALAAADPKLGEGVAFVALSYLVGVPFDRFADSVLLGLDHRQRVAFSRRKLGTRDAFKIRDRQVLVMEKGGALSEWLDYLRGRIRLARSMAVLLPAVTISAVLFVGWPSAGPVARGVQAGPPPGSVRLPDAVRLQDLANVPVGRALLLVSLVYVFALLGNTGDAVSSRQSGAERGAPLTWRCLGRLEPTLIAAASLLTIAVAFAAIAPAGDRAALAVAAGTVFSALSYWSWTRISWTRFEFLRSCEKRVSARAK